MKNYKPQDVKNITAVDWVVKHDENDEAYLNLVIKWQPAIDRTCSYDIVYFGIFDHSDQVEIDEEIGIKKLYEFTIPKRLHFDEEYSVGVRGKNTENPSLQSTPHWVKFKSPQTSCGKSLLSIQCHLT